MLELELKTVTIENINNRESILDSMALLEDEDFNGNNGKEYTSKEALKEGFNSNKDYIINRLQHITYKEPIELIQSYIEEWLKFDDYYRLYDYEVTYIDTKAVVTVAMVTD